MTSIDDEWKTFLNTHNSIGISCNGGGSSGGFSSQKNAAISAGVAVINVENTPLEETEEDIAKKYETSPPPKCDDLYISTKTKVLFLNQDIDIYNIFWTIPILDYDILADGIIKKQIKIVSKTPEEYEDYKKKLQEVPFYTETIIKQIHNPTARRIKFKDERKITIGISKKDIMNCQKKTKNAFYNCFAIILRFLFDDIYREIHVKVFNTGKMEIPGILNMEYLSIVKKMIIEILSPHVTKPVEFTENHNSENNVLINSNFNCNFFINREKLQNILTKKYGIETSFDPCSYPGVKCKFYFNNNCDFDNKTQYGKINIEDRIMKLSELKDLKSAAYEDNMTNTDNCHGGEDIKTSNSNSNSNSKYNKKYTEVSFMIFRTGSCLIVGNCTEKILVFIYDFIKQLLYDEYHAIAINSGGETLKQKKIKIRKKTFLKTI